MGSTLSPLAARRLMRLCIIVPILNEAQRLPRLLDELALLQRQGVAVILVDGGSDDDSAAMIEAAGFTLVRSDRGRARQMNAGAALASGDTLLFLHADTRLPAEAIQSIEQALAAGTACWGRFDVTLSGRSCLLRGVARMMNWRSRCSGIATGDQAIFVTRAAFDAVGGFPDQPLMEDIEISKRLKRRSRPACLRSRVTTSSRRWHDKGPWRTILLMWWLRWAYWRGTPAEQLARRYR